MQTLIFSDAEQVGTGASGITGTATDDDTIEWLNGDVWTKDGPGSFQARA